MNGSIGFTIFIVLVFVIINAVLIWLISIENKKLSLCKNFQSVFCPVVTCNDLSSIPGTTQSTAGKKCGYYAYRFLDPSGSLDDKNNIVCNNPS